MTKTALYHPKYWPSALLCALLWCIMQFPYRWQMALGRVVGRIAHSVLKRERHVAEVNIGLCFPDLSKPAQAELVLKNFESTGMALFETSLAWYGRRRQIEKLLHSVEGLEHIKSALARGKGVLLSISHFTHLNICGRLLREFYPFTTMYKKNKNAFLDFVMYKGISRYCDKLVDRDDIRTLIRSLKKNKIVWYAPDIDGGEYQGIFVPFFGVPASTITTTARLAKLTGAAVLPLEFYRRDDGCGYDLTIHPAIANFPSEDSEADTLRLTQIQEQSILKKPEQYLWQYKRFKTRPPGEPKVYAKNKTLRAH